MICVNMKMFKICHMLHTKGKKKTFGHKKKIYIYRSKTFFGEISVRKFFEHSFMTKPYFFGFSRSSLFKNLGSDFSDVHTEHYYWTLLLNITWSYWTLNVTLLNITNHQIFHTCFDTNGGISLWNDFGANFNDILW